MIGEEETRKARRSRADDPVKAENGHGLLNGLQHTLISQMDGRTELRKPFELG
jgi:hypothetical protein